MSVWWRIWALALAVKLALAAWLPLSPDEAYYWIWARNLQLSYYDHPPMIALLMALGEELAFGGRMLRWPAVILAHAGLWFWKDLFKHWLSERQQLLWLILVCFMPLPGLGSVIVTPDLPLMFSWSLMLWTLKNLLASGGNWKWGLAFGGAVGIGLLSKYMSVLMLPIAILWWWPRRTQAPLRSWLPGALVAAVALSAPVWVWNLQNELASFRFQLQHGLGKKSFRPSWVYEYALAQVGLIFPFIFYWAAKSRLSREWKVAAWLPLGFFLLTSFRGYVEANWPVMAHPLLLALSIERAGQARERWHRMVGALWLLCLLVIIGLVAAPQLPGAAAKTKLRDLRAMDKLIADTAELSPLYTRSYQTAAKLSYEQRRPVYKLKGMNRYDFFDTLPQAIPSGHRFYLVVEPEDRVVAPWNEWRLVARKQIDERYQVLELEKP